MNREAGVYEQLAQYMRLRYPDAIFHFDLSGLWTPSHTARNLYGRLNSRGWPDLFVAKAQLVHSSVAPCGGLFLELKRDGTRLKTKAGQWTTTRIKEQAVMLDALRDQGYYAEFAVGFDDAKTYIDTYLNEPQSVTENRALGSVF